VVLLDTYKPFWVILCQKSGAQEFLLSNLLSHH
jgi:hypothetical protein